MNKLIERYRSLPVAVKASGWYLVCNVVQNALGFITLPIFTRILTTEQYGLFTIYQSWMNILVIFTTLNVQYGVLDTAMIKYEKDRERFISSMQGMTTVLSVVWLLIYVTFHNLWNSLFELPTIVMVAMALEMCFLPAKDLWGGKQKFEYRYKQLVLYTLGLSILNPLICMLAVLNTDNRGIVRILAAVFVNLCFYIVLYIYNFIKGKTFYDRTYWKYALEFGVPLIVYYLSQMVFNQSDKIMIQHMVGSDKAGIYGLVYSCSIVAVVVINSINSAFVPWKYQHMQKKEYKDIGKVSAIISLLIGVMLMMVILGGPEIVKLIATEEYYEAIWIMPPVIGSLYFLFQAQLFVNIEFYYEEKGYLVRGSILSALLNIVLNYLAIPVWGYFAAGYTTLISYVVLAACNYYYMRKVCKEKMDNAVIYNIKLLMFMAVVFLGCVIGTALIYEYVALRWGILGAILFVVLINAKRILAWSNKLSEKG